MSEPAKKSPVIGLILILVGMLLVIIVFAEGYSAYKSYEINVTAQAQDTITLLNISAQILINMLIKIAFLGISLAAGTVLLSKGIDLTKQCPSEKK